MPTSVINILSMTQHNYSDIDYASESVDLTHLSQNAISFSVPNAFMETIWVKLN